MDIQTNRATSVHLCVYAPVCIDVSRTTLCHNDMPAHTHTAITIP